MRRTRGLFRLLLTTLLGALVVAGGLSLVVWQAPVLLAAIFADG